MRRFVGGFLATVALSMIWFVGAAWDLTPEEFWNRVRIDVTFSVCHPTFFACAVGLFLAILDRPVLNWLVGRIGGSLALRLLCGLILLALLLTILDFATRETAAYQVQPRPIGQREVAIGSKTTVEAFVRPIEVEDKLKGLYDRAISSSGKRPSDVESPKPGSVEWDYQQLAPVYARITSPPGFRMFRVINLAGLFVCLLTWFFMIVNTCIIGYMASTAACYWEDWQELRRRIADPRFILMIGMLGAWFPLRVYGDHWNVYYLPKPPINPALISLFVAWVLFIVVMVILYIAREGVPDSVAKFLGVLWPVIVAVAGIVILSGTPGTKAAYFLWIGQAIATWVYCTILFLVFFATAFVLGWVVVAAPESLPKPNTV